NGITLMPADALDDGSFDNCTNVHFRARRMTSCIDIDWTTGGACVDDIPGGVPPINDYDLGTAWGTCVPFACCDIGAGPIMVMLEVSDDVGNVNTCMVEVEVQDKIAPDVICPPVIFLSCDYLLEVHPGTYSDVEGNNNGNLDEDPLSALFGNMFDAFHYPESARQPIIINDPTNTQYHQPYNWGLDGWATDNCSVDLSVTVSVIDDCSGASFPGDHPANAVKLIERRFVANDGVQSGSCLQRIWVIDYHRFYISDTNCNNEDPNDGVIWPCDELVTTCPMEITNTGEPVILDDGCSLIGVTYEDTRFDFAEGACFKILREWKIIDWCQFNANTGYGLWTFTQTIRVADQEGAEFLECPSGLVELCTDDPGVSLPANNQVFLGENNPNSSSCSVHVIQHQPIREMCSTSVIYDVKLYVLGDPDPIQLKPETVLELDANHEGDLYFNTAESDIPDIANYGLSYNDPLCDDFYRVLWTVEDGCGNRTYCDYLMRLVDCKKPVPVCLDGISTNEMPPDGQVTLWASDFNASSYDDCTPSTQLLFSFSGDFYEPSFTFTCDNVPVFGVPFDVSIWAADLGYDQNCNGEVDWSERNKDLCIASLVITDNNDVCDQNGLVLVGEVTTEQTEAVSNATINLTTNQLNFPPFLTADDGKYQFGHLIPGLDYTIKPERNDNPRNGVSTLDLVQIQRHLLGKEPFSSSYQYIAADANNSGSVSAIDMIEIRKLILGLYSEFPNNTSWRFVRKEAGEASGPPWPLTEYIVLSDLQPNENKNLDFVGVKIGDVNHSAQAHATQLLPRNTRPVLKVNAKGNPEVKAGDEFEVRFTFPKTISGFQWTLETTGLEYAGIESNTIPIEDANVGLPDKDIITMSWNGEAALNNGKQGEDFTLRLKAIESGNLREMIRMTSRITQTEAYALDGTIMDVEMDVNSDSALTDFALYQNKPNPWDGQTLIEFDLPYEASARLTIYDIAGKVVKEIEANYKAGHNSIMLTSHDIPTPGVLYYRLDSGPYSAVKKMMIFH
ncbi:MAG TPA: T9SS type A sorting domain-containing protein, partial [Saprospiraceae bacterium]|nr:T9SS type A sorting domain-containing protein [Saprospiraceae bacterium]